ncbi:MAG TPA: serine/threonine-protein kinase [Thermoanaerobaculia bacterium]
MDALFADALEREGEERRRFLDEHCEPDLRGDVETMLEMARASEDFLETPVFSDALDVGRASARPDGLKPALHGLKPAPHGLKPAPHGLKPDPHGLKPDPHERFIPGDLVAGRYRIAGLLGRGGMGEVYRADDLRLGQPVALKFLAASLARDGAALARFHREVSVARRITDRHVCRVYDIGEHAGMQFLSMEYIRGEELSSLLKRIGRLPHDKAVDVARQLCSGLAAIHDAGVLHRDLKPANVMIDEHGNVRITDFGIVALSEGVSGREAMLGTPAYMSPEQRTGGELTTRSDLYALGLLLYECFTGKRWSASGTVPLDASIERVIERCLEEDPAKRPASALQVAAALPGGDPLAAALAAGETPSPQMVAAAPKEGSLRPAVAASLLVAIVAALLFVTLVSGRTRLHRIIPLDRSPELLQETAAKLARDAGYAAPRDTRWGFELEPEPVITFWYRQSPQPLVAADLGLIRRDDPPSLTSGMVRVELDPSGRLKYFEGVPPQVDPPASAVANWRDFFVAAGLDPSRFRPIETQWTPPQHSDSRLAWSDGTRRIEAASYRGRPTYFDVIGPGRKPSRQVAPRIPQPAFTVLLLAFYFGALSLAALLAWKNLRLGRGDRRGAFRLAALTFAARMLLWVALAHHVPSVSEVAALVEALQSALYWGCTIGLLHLALEPFVRRRWPEWIISWSRLLAGDVRDPLVGRDLLIGGAFGGAILVADQLSALVQGRPMVASPRLYDLGLLGARGFVGAFVNQLSAAFLFSFIVISIVLFFTMLTRRRAVAVGLCWLLVYALFSLNAADGSAAGYALAAIVPTLLMAVLVRFGVLALVSAMFFFHFSAFYPVTTELTAWYATSFILETIALLAVTLYGFRTSLAGQRVAGWLDE